MTGRRPVLSRELSQRERQIVTAVGSYRVLTGEQIRRWHFPTTDHGRTAGALRRCQRTLKHLVDEGILDTLDRRIGGVRAGSAGYCYVLAYRGQRLLDPDRRARSRYPLGNRFVDHALAVGELAVGLAEAAQGEEIEVLAVQPEPAAWRHYVSSAGTVDTLKPDLFTALGIGSDEHRWFVEVDRATESLARVDRKCRQYLTYLRSGREQEVHGVFPKVLWTVPHPKRYQQLVGVLSRLPPPSARLFVACLQIDALTHLKGGAP